MTSFHHCRLPDGTHPKRSNDVTVTDDGKEYVYRIARADRAAFKAWATDTFAGGMNCKRLVGAWPSFEVRQPS